MALKVTFKEWIILMVMFAVFVAITGFLITIFLDIPGHLVTMGALIVIFVIFKVQQWRNKKYSEENEDGEE